MSFLQGAAIMGKEEIRQIRRELGFDLAAAARPVPPPVVPADRPQARTPAAPAQRKQREAA